MRSDRRGQGALTDAMSFLLIMLVASSALYSYSGLLAREARASTAAEEIIFAQAMLTSLLRSTVSGAGYEIRGDIVPLAEMEASGILVQELAIRAVEPDADFDTCNRQISAMAEWLADGRAWAVTCELWNGTIVAENISFGGVPAEERASASVEFAMPGDRGGLARITLHTWRD